MVPPCGWEWGGGALSRHLSRGPNTRGPPAEAEMGTGDLAFVGIRTSARLTSACLVFSIPTGKPGLLS